MPMGGKVETGPIATEHEDNRTSRELNAWAPLNLWLTGTRILLPRWQVTLQSIIYDRV